jgi:hypothetical protein
VKEKKESGVKVAVKGTDHVKPQPYFRPSPPPKVNYPIAPGKDGLVPREKKECLAKDWFSADCEERGWLQWSAEVRDYYYHVDSEYERIVTSDDSDPTGKDLDEQMFWQRQNE